MERQPEQREAADGEKSKMVIRFRVWDALEAADAVLFPRPCHHRIPNCKGSAVACRRLLELPELRSATVVKVHPSIGAAALRSALLMATWGRHLPHTVLSCRFLQSSGTGHTKR